MDEPRILVDAREHLSKAEAGYESVDGLSHLEEALALLEEVRLDGEARHRTVAANLLSTYSTRICESIRKTIATDRALPEPRLEHLFRVLLAFDSADLELPAYVRRVKIDLVRGLIDRYYEGHPDAEKEEALRRLSGVAGDN